MRSRRALWGWLLALSTACLLLGGFLYKVASAWTLLLIPVALGGVVLFALASAKLRPGSSGVFLVALFAGILVVGASVFTAHSVWLSAVGEQRQCELTEREYKDPKRANRTLYEHTLTCGDLKPQWDVPQNLAIKTGPRTMVVDSANVVQAASPEEVSAGRNWGFAALALLGSVYVLLVVLLPVRRQPAERGAQ
ncbi:hypothetical protein [Saccharothrix variisporea]|uniref:hypothetical protein n=1 Tax=Saccharothrix variisporea TaxID=543527 RepID=UPI001B87DD22|nr:hypothetical protein [Saccharothrix variisporea]